MSHETTTPETPETSAITNAYSRIGDAALGSPVDALSMAAAKRAEFAKRDYDKPRAAEEERRRAIDERAEQERLAEEMAPTEDEIREIEAKKARMLEMDKWANTTGAIAVEKARKTAFAEKKLKHGVKYSKTVDDIDWVTQEFTNETSAISREGVNTAAIPGTTSDTYAHGGGSGYHEVIDDKGTTKSTAGGWSEINRSPKHIRDDSLPHGEEIDSTRIAFR